MNKYVIPICNWSKRKVYNTVVMSNSFSSCKDKIINMFQDYSDSDDYDEFVNDLKKQNILIGEITDIETL